MKSSIFIVIVLLLDQLTKFLIVKYLNLYETINIISNFVRLKYVENYGIAFGIGSNLDKPFKDLLFTSLTIIAIGIVIYYYRKVPLKKTFVRSSFALILGGALGNIFDKLFGYIIFHGQLKLFYGRVVDFIDIGFKSYRWPTFNVADIAITLGVIFLFILILRSDDKDLFSSTSS